MSNYSSLNMKGTVNITATDVNSGAVVQSQTVTNTIVRNGRVALSKLITGEAVMDKSYIELVDTTFPRTYNPVPDVSTGWMGLRNNGVDCLYYIGPTYTSNVTSNLSVAPVTRDISGFVTYLNNLFYAYSAINTQRSIPVYQADGTIATYVPYTIPQLKASVENRGGFPTVRISATEGGTGTIQPFSTYPPQIECFELNGQQICPPGANPPPPRFGTDDSLFGINTVIHTSEGVPSAESDYVVNGIQLGVSNGTTNITDSEFVPDTYVSPRYTPSVAYGQADAEGLYDTQVIFTVVIPASEGNGESGLGVTYTEAALLCRNEQWFAHTHFGQFYKSNQIQLTITWTVDFMP